MFLVISDKEGYRFLLLIQLLKQQLHYSRVVHGLVFRLKGMHNQKVDGELNSFGFLFMCWCNCFLFLAVI